MFYILIFLLVGYGSGTKETKNPQSNKIKRDSDLLPLSPAISPNQGLPQPNDNFYHADIDVSANSYNNPSSQAQGGFIPSANLPQQYDSNGGYTYAGNYNHGDFSTSNFQGFTTNTNTINTASNGFTTNTNNYPGPETGTTNTDSYSGTSNSYGGAINTNSYPSFPSSNPGYHDDCDHSYHGYHHYNNYQQRYQPPRIITKEIRVPVPQPYPVTVEKKVRVPVPQPYPVQVTKPVPYRVEVRVPVPVPRPYPVQVIKKIPIRIPVYVKVPQPYKVEVPVPRPYPVEKRVRVPVPVQVRVPVYIRVPVPVPTSTGNHVEHIHHNEGNFGGTVAYHDDCVDGGHSGFQGGFEGGFQSGNQGGIPAPVYGPPGYQSGTSTNEIK